MSRDLTAAMQTAVEQAVLIPAYFVEFETASGDLVRMWSGYGDYYWPLQSPPSDLWKGVGNLLDISDMGETTDGTALGVKVTLSGIPSEMVDAALNELIPGKEAKIWMALFDTSGNLIEDPYQAFAGRVDAIDMEEGGKDNTCAITVSVESRMIDLQVSNERRWTAEDQKIDWPNDTAYDFVEQLQELNINLGIAPPIPQVNN